MDPQGVFPQQEPATNKTRDESDDVELLGWRTRLIERADRNHQTIRTIHVPVTPDHSHITQDSNRPVRRDRDASDLAEVTLPNQTLSATTYDSTDDLVRVYQVST